MHSPTNEDENAQLLGKRTAHSVGYGGTHEDTSRSVQDGSTELCQEEIAGNVGEKKLTVEEEKSAADEGQGTASLSGFMHMFRRSQTGDSSLKAENSGNASAAEVNAKPERQESRFRYFIPKQKPNSEIIRRRLMSKDSDAEEVDYKHDVMMYKNAMLLTWEAFYMGSSVWSCWELWSMMINLTLLSFIVAVTTFLLVPDPAALHLAAFTEVCSIFDVLIGLLMGFFLHSSASRWHSCVHGFLALLDGVRNLQMQLEALGVPLDRTRVVSRLGVASAWLLFGDLLKSWQRFTRPKHELEKEMWDFMSTQRVDLDGYGKAPLLEDDEMQRLRPMKDPAGIMWFWISLIVGTLSDDGLIPGMATPTYGRVMDLCKAGRDAIRFVRASVIVQAPLPYTRTLALLVHINNMLNFVCLGMVMGCATGTALARENLHAHDAKATGNEWRQDMQTMAVTIIHCFVCPFMYQGILIMAFHLAQPFDHEDACMPFDVLLQRLEIDLRHGSMLLDRIPHFKRPAFKAAS